MGQAIRLQTTKSGKMRLPELGLLLIERGRPRYGDGVNYRQGVGPDPELIRRVERDRRVGETRRIRKEQRRD